MIDASGTPGQDTFQTDLQEAMFSALDQGERLLTLRSVDSSTVMGAHVGAPGELLNQLAIWILSTETRVSFRPAFPAGPELPNRTYDLDGPMSGEVFSVERPEPLKPTCAWLVVRDLATNAVSLGLLPNSGSIEFAAPRVTILGPEATCVVQGMSSCPVHIPLFLVAVAADVPFALVSMMPTHEVPDSMERSFSLDLQHPLSPPMLHRAGTWFLYAVAGTVITQAVPVAFVDPLGLET